MRAFFSYGLALTILALAAAWLVTGTFVNGGNGPGNGERPILSIIEGQDDGPIARTLAGAGLLAEHHSGDGSDPTLTIAQRAALATGADAALQSVRTSLFIARPMPIEVPLRGRTQARATVSAVAETMGIIETVHVVKGQRVEIGDALCTLDQGTRAAAVAQAEAGLAQAEAGLVQAELDFETNAELRAKGLAPANTANSYQVALSSARAAVSAAQAGLDNANAELARTVIRARIPGIVQDPLATEGAMLGQGSPCAAIVQLDPILFAGMVPEAHIGLARLGLEASIRTVTGQTAEGKVTYISSSADGATRAFPVEIEIPNADLSIRDGMTAQAVVTVGTAPGHLLPQSVLTLDDGGVLGVRTVEGGVVAFHPVTIVSDTREGIWVSGLPVRAEVITVGQEFVTAGQPVNAVRGSADAGEASAP